MTSSTNIACLHHPQYPAEKLQLQNTIQIINDLCEALRQDLEQRLEKKLDHDSWGYDANAEIIDLYIQKSKEDDLYDLESVENSPYFARVDFRTDGHVRPETFYIGRVGVNEFRRGFNPGNNYVVDWRTPVAAGVFYRAKNGRAFVDAPGESYSGDILLKRQYEIEAGQLYDFTDDDTMDKFLGDKFLVTKLLKGANQRLKDIVSTIQQEQDEIIRRPLNEVTLVQGVAGSGKTTVGLHRIAYLIYTYKIPPAKVAVVAPNRLFLHYISDVLPGLHADGVWQGTFEELAEEMIGFSVNCNRESLIDELIKEHGWREDDGFIQGVRLQGSLEYKQMLDDFINDWKEKLAATHQDIQESISDGKKAIELTLSGEAISNRLRDNHSPVNKVMQGINSYIRQQLTEQVRRALDLYEVKAVGGRAAKRKELIELPIPPIYQQALEDCISKHTIGILKVSDFYRSFLRVTEMTSVNKDFDQEDLAGLCYLQLKLEGVKEAYCYDHIMVDEAQDRTAFELLILSLLSKRESVTLLGDINQAIHAYRSFGNWDELRSCFSRSSISFYTMRMSYRSAAEVVEWCNRLIANPQARGIPVYHVDQKAELTKIKSKDEAMIQIASTIGAWRKEGIRSIGIIAKHLDECKFIYSQLKACIPKEEFQIISTEMNEFRLGISIVPIALAKGLEFDGVIVADASEEHYQKTEMDRNLLYVALSRALYRLHIFYEGRLSSYLKDTSSEDVSFR